MHTGQISNNPKFYRATGFTMIKRFTTTAFFVLASFGLASQASANLIIKEYGSGATPDPIFGYDMTDFVMNDSLSIGDTTSSITSDENGTLLFKKENGTAADMTYKKADDVWWWLNAETDYNYDIFTTTDLHWVEIFLPANTRAFSFTVGAGYDSAGGWLKAKSSDGSVTDKTSFKVNNEYTPSFGVYADNTDGSCSAITSVIIEPSEWGFGNLSINQDDCTSVPEPAPIALLALGLIGLGFMRRKNNT